MTEPTSVGGARVGWCKMGKMLRESRQRGQGFDWCIKQAHRVA